MLKCRRPCPRRRASAFVLASSCAWGPSCVLFWQPLVRATVATSAAWAAASMACCVLRLPLLHAWRACGPGQRPYEPCPFTTAAACQYSWLDPPPYDRAHEDRCEPPSERCRGARATHGRFGRCTCGFASAAPPRSPMDSFWLLRWQDTSALEATSRDRVCSRAGGRKKGTYSSELVGGRDALADELLEELDVERRVVAQTPRPEARRRRVVRELQGPAGLVDA